MATIDDETRDDPTQSAGAPVNRDARREPEVIEGEIAGRETSVNEPPRDAAQPEAPRDSAAPEQAARPEAPPPPPPPPRTGARGFLGGALAGLIVSALGLGAGYTLFASKTDVSENANRFSAVESQVRRDSSALIAEVNGDRAAMANLEKRIGALEAGAGASNTSDLEQKVAALEASAKASNTADLAKRVAALEAAKGGNSADSDAIQRLSAEEKDLRADIDAARGAIPDISARVAKLETDAQKASAATADLAALTARVDKIETALAAPKTETPTRYDNAAAMAVIAEAAGDRLRAGEPLGPDLEALKHLGVDAATLAPLEAVANGAPTDAALAASFSAVASHVLAATSHVDKGSVAERFLAHLHGLVQVRDLNETAGDDPQALVSQVEASSRRGDIRGALASFDKLPPAARQAAGDWPALARQREAAEAALQSIREKAIAGLAAGPKP
jgi:hypothetical protein